MKHKWWLKMLLLITVGLLVGTTIYMSFTFNEVKGTDDQIGDVIKIYTQKAGVSQRAPYINTNKGDLLLFLFCFAGLVVGFYLGYQWRKIITQRPIGNNSPSDYRRNEKS
jgi:hypothetical protein